MNLFCDILIKNGFVAAMVATGVILFLANWISKNFFRNKIPGTAIAILAGLVIAYLGGWTTGGTKGVADVPIWSGFAILGGTLFRDFTIVATAMGARFSEMKKAGIGGALSLFLGVIIAFAAGAALAVMMGYRDAESITTIAAGACTFIVGPVTGSAIGASSEVIALSIAAGVVKSIAITIATPLVARSIGLNNPQYAMIYGGLIGTTSGVAAGLAATDPKLVPYGALTATFYTGLGCLLCPSVLYMIVKFLVA